MSENQIYNEYIQRAIDQEQQVKVYLVNGVGLTGQIFRQDATSIVMTCKEERTVTREQLVLKSAISTIST